MYSPTIRIGGRQVVGWESFGWSWDAGGEMKIGESWRFETVSSSVGFSSEEFNDQLFFLLQSSAQVSVVRSVYDECA